MEYQVQARNLPTDPFLRAYLECAEWCGLDDDGQEALELAAVPKWTPKALEQAKTDCDAFLAEWGLLVESDLSQAGHDFWLTRNRHGAGFWDGDWPKAVADKLTAASHAFGEVDVEFDSDTEELSFL